MARWECASNGLDSALQHFQGAAAGAAVHSPHPLGWHPRACGHPAGWLGRRWATLQEGAEQCGQVHAVEWSGSRQHMPAEPNRGTPTPTRGGAAKKGDADEDGQSKVEPLLAAAAQGAARRQQERVRGRQRHCGRDKTMTSVGAGLAHRLLHDLPSRCTAWKLLAAAAGLT